jgi:hypothetical protein
MDELIEIQFVKYFANFMLVQPFSAFYGTVILIAVFTKVRH